MIARWLTICLVAALTACSSATPRAEYPRFYGNWSHVGSMAKEGLDSLRRDAAANPEDLESILSYARVTSRLAREQASRWFEIHDRALKSKETQRLRVTAARSRLLEGCHHATVLYREAELKGATLRVSDRVNLVWLHLFSGRQLEAEAVLDSLSNEDALSESVRQALERVRSQLSEELDRDVSE